jgi:predicted amidohydrolase
VVARLEDPLETGIAVAEIDLEKLQAIRAKMPIAEHRVKGRAVVVGGGGGGGGS